MNLNTVRMRNLTKAPVTLINIFIIESFRPAFFFIDLAIPSGHLRPLSRNAPLRDD